MKRIVLFALVVFSFVGVLSAQSAFVVRDGVVAYSAMDDKAAPVVTFMKKQKLEVVEKYRLATGQWSKVQVSKGHFAYIKTAELADKP
jgi:hypothetical protein